MGGCASIIDDATTDFVVTQSKSRCIHGKYSSRRFSSIKADREFKMPPASDSYDSEIDEGDDQQYPAQSKPIVISPAPVHSPQVDHTITEQHSSNHHPKHHDYSYQRPLNKEDRLVFYGKNGQCIIVEGPKTSNQTPLVIRDIPLSSQIVTKEQTEKFNAAQEKSSNMAQYQARVDSVTSERSAAVSALRDKIRESGPQRNRHHERKDTHLAQDTSKADSNMVQLAPKIAQHHDSLNKPPMNNNALLFETKSRGNDKPQGKQAETLHPAANRKHHRKGSSRSKEAGESASRASSSTFSLNRHAFNVVPQIPVKDRFAPNANAYSKRYNVADAPNMPRAKSLSARVPNGNADNPSTDLFADYRWSRKSPKSHVSKLAKSVSWFAGAPAASRQQESTKDDAASHRHDSSGPRRVTAKTFNRILRNQQHVAHPLTTESKRSSPQTSESPSKWQRVSLASAWSESASSHGSNSQMTIMRPQSILSKRKARGPAQSVAWRDFDTDNDLAWRCPPADQVRIRCSSTQPKGISHRNAALDREAARAARDAEEEHVHRFKCSLQDCPEARSEWIVKTLLHAPTGTVDRKEAQGTRTNGRRDSLDSSSRNAHSISRSPQIERSGISAKQDSRRTKRHQTNRSDFWAKNGEPTKIRRRTDSRFASHKRHIREHDMSSSRSRIPYDGIRHRPQQTYNCHSQSVSDGHDLNSFELYVLSMESQPRSAKGSVPLDWQLSGGATTVPASDKIFCWDDGFVGPV